VILPRSVADELAEHIRNGPTFLDPNALVFTTEGGAMIDLHNFRARVWAPAVKRAGLDRVRIYDLRHTAASNMIAAGIDVVTVSETTGHSTAVLLATYSHFVEEAGRRAADILDAAFASGR
jgi:integrase